MIKKLLVSTVFLIFLTSVLASAQTSTPTTTDSQSLDVGSWMIKKGMDLWWYSVGDSLIGMGNGGNTTVSREEVPGLIFKMITYTVDPFQMQWVKDWWGIMLVFYTIVVFMVILGGAAWVLIHTMSPGMAQKLDWVLGNNFSNFHFKKWIGTILKAASFPYFVYFGIYVVLVLNWAISGLITQNTLDVIPLNIHNVVYYILMAIGYFWFSLIMAIRNIIIVLFAAGGLGIAALYLVSSLEDLIVSVFYYFLMVVFMQPILIFEASVGVKFVQSLPDTLILMQPMFLLAVIVIMGMTAIVIILGPVTVMKVINGAKKVVLT